MDENIDVINSIWEMISEHSNDFEKSIDKYYRKSTGSYFTPLELAYSIVKELIDSIPLYEQQILFKKKFLEPCVGTGNFVFAYLRVCKEKKFSPKQYYELIDNIYVCDINSQALDIYKKSLSLLVSEWFGIILTDEYFEKHIGGALIVDINSVNPKYISIEETFGDCVVKNGFDIIITNPPYKSLRAESSHYSSSKAHEYDKQKYNIIKQIAYRNFTYSIDGVLNLYRLFTEEILTKYLSSNGFVSLLIPTSILSDKTCSRLRTYMLENTSIKSIKTLSENNRFIDASQALCVTLIHKGENTKKILVNKAFGTNYQKSLYVLIDDIIDKSTGNAILVLTEEEYEIRNYMRRHPIIKNIAYINNMRGELDVTINKNSILNTETTYPLIRGRNIGYYRFVDNSSEFIDEKFIEHISKRQYITKERLVCQQIANMEKDRRITFALIPHNYIVANSCNFISIEDNQDDVDIFFLMGILNSELIDWYFKLTSSNNHINNYEIDTFPIPIKYNKKNKISSLVKQYLNTFNKDLLKEIEVLVYDAYGIPKMQNKKHNSSINNIGEDFFQNSQGVLKAFYNDLKNIYSSVTFEQCENILLEKISIDSLYSQIKNEINLSDYSIVKHLIDKYRLLCEGLVLNHTSFKLSDLDLEMIKSVPQGGNWKNIPISTVQKSKRLSKIVQTGGRTTLYGRIDYSKPSYTITTYFNRPGNGTYIHPIHNRVLSVREAARLQSFPDDYYFCGTKSDILKQVGNAVPVLLAYTIGRNIYEKTGYNTSIDLFSGAGGMTYGFKIAGINTIIANDISESACLTLKVNCPDINVLCGDITQDTIKQKIINTANANGADIVCGGPPCQGFSLAGHRMKNDSRNQLFLHFIDIVLGVNPKIIVFENVEGIISYQGGEIYRSILDQFLNLGYNIEARKLYANHYGIPQRRKRVIILCTRKDIGITPDELFPLQYTPDDDFQISVYEAIYDLEQVVCNDRVKYNSSYISPYIKYLKHNISFEEYLNTIARLRE